MLAAQARGEGRDLTLRQLALLAAVYQCEQPPTVRALAAELGLSKPVISRAIDALEGLELCRRLPDPNDRRSVVVQKTVRGSVFVDRLVGSFRGLNAPA
jgi:DNA-binding MarR family transcriptional regulator